MLLRDLWAVLEEHVFPRPSTEELFNPYRDRNEAVDLPDAPAIRRQNLRSYLACYETLPPPLLVAEAPGPWGCRFCGVPLASEAKLVDTAFPIHGRPSGTHETPHKEYSAGIYWRVLRPYFPHFFTWNSVPLHPHPAGEPLAIRTPRRSEVQTFEPALAGLVEALRPEHVAAVGRKAERALREIGVGCTYVRHPSQGGARMFEAGVLALLKEMHLPPVS